VITRKSCCKYAKEMSECVRRESVSREGRWSQINVYVCDGGQSRDGRLSACLLRRLCGGKVSPKILGSKQGAKNKTNAEEYNKKPS
jgi:hypothetical protein